MHETIGTILDGQGVRDPNRTEVPPRPLGTAKQRGEVTEPWTYLSNSCWQATCLQLATLAKFDVVIAPLTYLSCCM